jgi:hypothetical protein
MKNAAGAFAQTFRRGRLLGSRRLDAPGHSLIAWSEELPTSHPDVQLTIWRGAGKLFATAYDRAADRTAWYDVEQQPEDSENCELFQ